MFWAMVITCNGMNSPVAVVVTGTHNGIVRNPASKLYHTYIDGLSKNKNIYRLGDIHQ